MTETHCDTVSLAARLGRPPFRTVVSMFRHAVATRPDAPALRCEERSFTYAEYGRCVAALTALLTRDGRPNDRLAGRRVAMILPNGPEMAVATFAALAAGAQATFLNPAYPEAELRPLLADAAPDVVIGGFAAAPMVAALAADLGIPQVLLFDEVSSETPGLSLEAWRGDPGLTLPEWEPDPEDPATLMYTGGTTGVSKGVNHTHAEVMLTIQGMEACWPTRDEGEVWLNVAPMFHIWGLLMGCLNPAYGRALLVIVPRYKPETVVDAMSRYRVTVFGGGPAAIYNGLLAAANLKDADLSALRVCPGGGSSFALETLKTWERVIKVPIYEAFGMSEVAPITANMQDRPRKPGSVGVPAPNIEVQIVDLETGRTVLPAGERGEIRVRAPHALKSYRNRPDETARTVIDGWVHTGDIGYLDEDGYLYIVDRKKDMVIVGGFNVYPREIDEVLFAHPGVHEAATIGVPDPRKGERPVSFVACAPGAAVSEPELVEHCRHHLVDYKVPQTIRVVEMLPRTPANKIDRKALRRMVQEDAIQTNIVQAGEA